MEDFQEVKGDIPVYRAVHNKPINADSKKWRDKRAPLLAAGHGQRYPSN
jgi:hypothetical protein